jgi:hypothetical protein
VTVVLDVDVVGVEAAEVGITTAIVNAFGCTEDKATLLGTIRIGLNTVGGGKGSEASFLLFDTGGVYKRP